MTSYEKAAAKILGKKYVRFELDGDPAIHFSDEPIDKSFRAYGNFGRWSGDETTSGDVTTLYLDGQIPEVGSSLVHCCGVAEIGNLYEIAKEIPKYKGLKKIFLTAWFEKTDAPFGGLVATVTGEQSKKIAPLLEEFGFVKGMTCKSNHGKYPIHLYTKTINKVRTRTVAVKSSRSAAKDA